MHNLTAPRRLTHLAPANPTQCQINQAVAHAANQPVAHAANPPVAHAQTAFSADWDGFTTGSPPTSIKDDKPRRRGPSRLVTRVADCSRREGEGKPRCG